MEGDLRSAHIQGLAGVGNLRFRRGQDIDDSRGLLRSSSGCSSLKWPPVFCSEQVCTCYEHPHHGADFHQGHSAVHVP